MRADGVGGIRSSTRGWQNRRVTDALLTVRHVDGPEPRRTHSGAVVLDWWVDLASPNHSDTVELLDDLRDRFGDDVDVRVRHFPLAAHVWAVAAAQCQCEADVQDRGMTYAAHAVAALDTIEGPADYVDLAEHLGLDEEQFALALFDGRHASRVSDDHDAGRALGVTSTPTFVVDGLLVAADQTREGALAVLSARISSALGR